VTYQETLDWMFAQLPMYQQKGQSALNNKLDNILGFSKLLGDPHKNFRSIHVAGTNGKGSSCHVLASILQEAGYKVGLYTSPHLKDFRERIKINGVEVPKRFVTSFIKKHMSFLKDNRLSFFEMTVGMAFEYFSEQKVDIAIIEVGLGGRLDSTNIITPEVSLITNIGFDHTHILGNTLEKIAFEKAGIIKKGIPVVVSERQVETELVFKQVANERHSELVFAEDVMVKDYETDLLGNYQKKNITGVVTALNRLENFDVSEENIEQGLLKVISNTKLLGRWQVLQNRPKVVCDTAHNPEGIQMVTNQIASNSFNILHIVLGVVTDKELDKLLPLFPNKAKYYFVKPNVQRGLSAKKLEKAARAHGLLGRSYMSVRKGLSAALLSAKDKDFIFVGGSTFVVAEVV